MAGPGLIPFIQRVQYSQDDGRLEEFDVCIGFIYTTRTRTLANIVERGGKVTEQYARGNRYLLMNEVLPPPAEPPAGTGE